MRWGALGARTFAWFVFEPHFVLLFERNRASSPTCAVVTGKLASEQCVRWRIVKVAMLLVARGWGNIEVVLVAWGPGERGGGGPA